MFRKIALVTSGLLFVAVSFAAVSVAEETAFARTYYSWTTDDGSFAYTDDPKLIPSKYREVVKTNSFADLDESVQTTTMDAPSAVRAATAQASLKRARAVQAVEVRNPNHLQGCTGPITVELKRRNHTERGHSYNSLFFVVRNACGDVKSVTRSRPIPYIRVE